jgi:hypothetical protein
MTARVTARDLFEQQFPGVLANLEKATFDTAMAQSRRLREGSQHTDSPHLLHAYFAVGRALAYGHRPPRWAAEIVGHKLLDAVVSAYGKETPKRDAILRTLGLAPWQFREFRADCFALGLPRRRGRRDDEHPAKRTRERDRARAKQLLGGSAKATRRKGAKKSS